LIVGPGVLGGGIPAFGNAPAAPFRLLDTRMWEGSNNALFQYAAAGQAAVIWAAKRWMRRKRGPQAACNQSSGTARSSCRSRSGSATRSISTIFPRVMVKPNTTVGRPP
jgi:hypothetical protein